MNRAMTKNFDTLRLRVAFASAIASANADGEARLRLRVASAKQGTRMIINDLQTACGVHWTYHGELHPAFAGQVMTIKIKIINI